MPLVLPNANHPIRTALKHNLQNAMHTALLLLPGTFQEENLYQTLAGLSYSGYTPLNLFLKLLLLLFFVTYDKELLILSDETLCKNMVLKL